MITSIQPGDKIVYKGFGFDFLLGDVFEAETVGEDRQVTAVTRKEEVFSKAEIRLTAADAWWVKVGCHFTLGDLVDQLSALPEDAQKWPCMLDNGMTAKWDECDSWRGSYDEASFQMCDTVSSNPPTVAEVAGHLDRSIGCHIYGYKGGDFYVKATSEVHLDGWSVCSNQRIIGIRVEAGRVVLLRGKLKGHEDEDLGAVL